ncbi:MAG: ATP-grasp domain-containing protein [Phycisphaeraceae bacterium]|nr:ATP-grasp domain-containing protein [Phycisphaeraceae bacterium]
MRVFVFEHVCGGGMIRQPLDSATVERSSAVLSAVVDDFLRAGVQVLTTLDHRISLRLEGAQVLRADGRSSIEAVIDQLAAEADYALVIAPETEGILESWSAKLTAAGARRLGSRPDAVALCADKLGFADAMMRGGVPTPLTRRLNVEAELAKPVIVKRRRGAGCEEVYLCRTKGDLSQVPFGRDWIMQDHAAGAAVSASFILHGGVPRRLQVCRQVVEGSLRLHYRGGSVPVDETLAGRAFALAERALERVPGLRGFVDVDLVLAEEGEAAGQDVVLEINPRVTMSYIGLKALCETSVAVAIVEGAAPLRWRKGPVRFDTRGKVEAAVAVG